MDNIIVDVINLFFVFSSFELPQWSFSVVLFFEDKNFLLLMQQWLLFIEQLMNFKRHFVKLVTQDASLPLHHVFLIR